jgi:hypothetical protein
MVPDGATLRLRRKKTPVTETHALDALLSHGKARARPASLLRDIEAVRRNA